MAEPEPLAAAWTEGACAAAYEAAWQDGSVAIGYGEYGYFRAGYLAAVEAVRPRLAATVAELRRRAFRAEQRPSADVWWYCTICGGDWRKGDAEHHERDCPAQPLTSQPQPPAGGAA